MSNQMQWVNAFSTRPSLEAAVTEVVEAAQKALQASADLAIVFISSAFASDYSRLMPLLREQLAGSTIIGCGGGGVVGSSSNLSATYEAEQEPALSLTLAHLPDVEVRTFRILEDELPDLDGPPDAWVELLGIAPEAQSDFILLADPFTSSISDLLQGLDFAYPNSAKVGGLASASMGNRGMSLFCNYSHYEEGIIGVALSGRIEMETIVAQGCRPIGNPYRVVQGERNIITELEETQGDMPSECSSPQPPLQALQTLIQSLSYEDRKLAQHSLFIGIARDEFKQELEQGDFLIRNLLGVDPRIGAIALGDRVRPGQRIQFHLRDAHTSAEDLELWLQKCQARLGDSAVGALMFSCLGRGENLYHKPNFESQLFQQYFKNTALNGFFCNGEIGPVGKTTFLHGYTSVFGIFRQPQDRN
ncbi:FIST signal transduction protein [Lusitaniella coriacea]|uniref:FIST signal transduction protein n=1 Tax=Lusitaniella coriacea TaxID=1983105 RepID=UPI003CF47FB8